jgi:hypothetical protein
LRDLAGGRTKLSKKQLRRFYEEYLPETPNPSARPNPAINMKWAINRQPAEKFRVSRIFLAGALERKAGPTGC